MSEPISLSTKTGDATYSRPESALRDALSEIGRRGAFIDGKKLLVLCLDDTNENFNVSFIQAGMKMSERITLCEVAKTIFLKEMEYIS